jgi:DNA-binding NarL/FixJ family response regulator
MSVTALLVDDHTLLRESLRRSLEGAGLSVVADVGDGDAALETAERAEPMVVLMDVSLPGRDGIEVTREFSSRFPGTAVIMLTMFADEPTVRAAFGAGASAYLVKDCTTAEMISTINEVARQQANGRAEPARSYLRSRSHVAGRCLLVAQPLTHREVEVLQMLANGASNTEVARKLFISSKTVKNHLAHIYSKLGVERRTQAVAKAVRLGLVRIG